MKSCIVIPTVANLSRPCQVILFVILFASLHCPGSTMTWALNLVFSQVPSRSLQ
ncbi:hypothetical protein BT69DRAFT_527669 [Atractiella rhizophila]|nr:hypothetical protein BT69DRAFT_527669 [Atractiella rhizophila]